MRVAAARTAVPPPRQPSLSWGPAVKRLPSGDPFFPDDLTLFLDDLTREGRRANCSAAEDFQVLALVGFERTPGQQIFREGVKGTDDRLQLTPDFERQPARSSQRFETLDFLLGSPEIEAPIG